MKLFYAAFAILVLLHTAVLSTSRLLPFTDLPNHLASATIVRHYGEPGNEFSGYYDVDLFPKPNVLHLLFCRIALFPSAESATRAWFAIYSILLPLSVLLLIRRLGGNGWPAILSLLLLYNYSVSWGFVGFAMAVPLALLSARASIGAAREGGTGRLALSAALMLLTFLAHAIAAAYAALIHIVFVLVTPRLRPARRAARSLAVLPAAAMAFAWWFLGRSFWMGRSMAEYLSEYYSGEYFAELPRRVKMLVLDNYHLYDGPWGIAVAALFALSIIAAALYPLLADRFKRGGAPARSADEGRSGRERSLGRYALALLAVSLSCFLLMPRGIPGQEILAERFMALTLLSAVVVAGVSWRRNIPRLAPAAAAVLCALHLILWWSNFRSFNLANEGFAPSLFPEAGRGEILSGIIYDYRWRGRPSYIHFPSYYITWKKGIAATSVIGYRFGAVRRKAPINVLPAYREWLGRTGGYDGRYGNISYLILRGDPPAGRQWEIDGFREIRFSGDWKLLENESMR